MKLRKLACVMRNLRMLKELDGQGLGRYEKKELVCSLESV